MKDKCDVRECTEPQIRQIFDELISCETNNIYTDAMQHSIRQEGYEHFKLRAFKKLENGHYIVDMESLGLLNRKVVGEI